MLPKYSKSVRRGCNSQLYVYWLLLRPIYLSVHGKLLKIGLQYRLPFPTRLTDVFSERELTFTFAICYRPSVCRLSVVCRL